MQKHIIGSEALAETCKHEILHNSLPFPFYLFVPTELSTKYKEENDAVHEEFATMKKNVVDLLTEAQEKSGRDKAPDNVGTLAEILVKFLTF